MKKILSTLGAILLTAAVFAAPSHAQYANEDLIGNGDQYGPPKGTAPHFFTQPLIFPVGDSATISFDGDIDFGGRFGRFHGINIPSLLLKGTLGSTLTTTTSLGWDFGARIEGSGLVSYTFDVPDPLFAEAPLRGVKAYVFADTPTIDLAVGRFDPVALENSGRGTLNRIIDPPETKFSSAVGGRLAGSIGTRQGPWTVTAAADIDNRQYAALQWKRPVRTVTPSIGIEFLRDGNFDLATTPLSFGVQPGTAQLYGTRAGAQLEYGRLTFGASAGLEAFYDGTTMLEVQSMYDVGISNKTGRFIYGVSAQHRRSHQVPVSSTSVLTDMTIALTRGVDLELAYKFRRIDDQALLEPIYEHAALVDMRVKF